MGTRSLAALAVAATALAIGAWSTVRTAAPAPTVASHARTPSSRAPSTPRDDAPAQPRVHRRHALARPTLPPLPSLSAAPPLTPDDDARLDADALAAFESAFDREPRDEAWGAAMEASIADVLATTREAPALEDVECRATLCRIELRGSADGLPSADPFTAAGWWLEGDDGTALLLLVRDGAELPFSS